MIPRWTAAFIPELRLHSRSAAAVSVLLCAALEEPRTVQAQILGPRTDLTTGAVPRSVEIADVNGDGHRDILVAVQGANEVSIFRGNGDLTFQPRVDVPTRLQPTALAVVDWTGDNKLDLLVGCGGDTTLTVYAGNGAGQFVAGASVHCPTVPWAIDVGDVTGDGRPDAVVSADEPSVAMFTVPGTAGGGFGAPQVWVTDPGARSRSLALAQIDGQPGLDVYLGTQGGQSRVLRNDGAGGFAAQMTVGGSAASYGVALGDWSGDGILDAVEVGPVGLGGSLRFLRGAPNGTFTFEKQIDAPANPRAPILASLDTEPGLDVAFVSSSNALIVLGLSNCGHEPSETAGVDLAPEDLAMADLDHDGDLDFASANMGGASVTVRRNQGISTPGCIADAAFLPFALVFGEAGLGVPNTAALNVFNHGDGVLQLSAATVGTAEFTVLTVFPRTVPPHGSVSVLVRSNRLALGSHADTLRISTNDPNHPLLVVPLLTSVRPATPPSAVWPDSLVLPDSPQGVPVVGALRIDNVGEGELVLYSATLGTPEFEMVTTLPRVIPSLQSGVIEVMALHTNAGTARDTLRLDSNDPAAPVLVIPLVASERTPQPVPVMFPTTLDFGWGLPVGPDTLSFQLWNAGELPFAVTSVVSPFPVYHVIGIVPTVDPGDTVTVAVRYTRNAIGSHNGAMRFFTDDPLHPYFDIQLYGTTWNSPSAFATFDPTNIHFGQVLPGEARLESVRIHYTAGSDPLVVTALSTTTPWFTAITPVPVIATPSQDGWIVVRVQAADPGVVRDTLVIVSNHATDPVKRIPLEAAVAIPPSIDLDPESLPPVDLPFGEVATRSVAVRNVGPEAALSVTATVVVDSVQSAWEAGVSGPPPVGLVTTTLPAIRLDSEGHTWDVRGDGSIGTGDPGGFAAGPGGGLAWTGYPELPTAEMLDGNRAFHLSTVQGAFVLERTVHISPFEPWIRYLDTVTNLGASPVQVTIPIRSQLDLALPRSTATSSGDLAFQTLDDWVVVADDLAPTIAHVIAGPGGIRPSTTSLTNGTRDLRYTFQFSVEPGASGSILHYALQAASREEAIERAEALRTPFGPALAGLDFQARSRVRNFVLGSPFSLPVPALLVPSGQQRSLLVGFDGAVGSAGETIFGTLLLASNDPVQPLVSLPLELRIGPAAGPDPLPVEPVPGGTLALAARVSPNPVRSGRLQLSYVLPEAGTARFELFDVRGRRIAERTLEDAPAGPGTIQWGAVEGRLAAGVVWMRLTQGMRAVTTRAVILP